MKAKLYREDAETRDTDIKWSVVGPGHDRAYFNLIPIAGYSGTRMKEHKHPYYEPPYTIYTMGRHDIGTHPFKTIPAAKRALRKWINQWVSGLNGEMTWEASDTGVHWTGYADKIQVANYYFCPEPIGDWHKDFKVWFGGTYYITKFESPEEARAAVKETFASWLTQAKASLLVVKG